MGTGAGVGDRDGADGDAMGKRGRRRTSAAAQKRAVVRDGRRPSTGVSLIAALLLVKAFLGDTVAPHQDLDGIISGQDGQGARGGADALLRPWLGEAARKESREKSN